MKAKFDDMQGIIPIMQTPFTDDGSAVDYDDFARMCDATVCDGAKGIALFGYGTEFYKLSDREREDMVTTAVKAVDGRVPVIASITCGSTEVAVQTAQHYEKSGVDAVMVLSPSVIAPSTPALAEHIISVGNSTALPCVIQYTPGSGGGTLTAQAIQMICEKINHPLCIKAEAIPAAPFVDKVREITDGKIRIFAGNMCLHMIDLMDRGVVGFMPGVSLVPIFRTIFDTYMAGDRRKAKELYDVVMPMVLVINQDIETLVKYEKMMMVKRGIIKSSCCRKPTCVSFDERLWNMFDEYRENLKQIIDVGRNY